MHLNLRSWRIECDNLPSWTEEEFKGEFEDDEFKGEFEDDEFKEEFEKQVEVELEGRIPI